MSNAVKLVIHVLYGLRPHEPAEDPFGYFYAKMLEGYLKPLHIDGKISLWVGEHYGALPTAPKPTKKEKEENKRRKQAGEEKLPLKPACTPIGVYIDQIVGRGGSLEWPAVLILAGSLGAKEMIALVREKGYEGPILIYTVDPSFHIDEAGVTSMLDQFSKGMILEENEQRWLNAILAILPAP